VALVELVESDGGQRAAAGTPRPQGAHSTRSHVSERLVVRMPTLS
jgi:hypothetical protein